MSEPEFASFLKLRNIIAQLREPQGCPWDREQTHSSLRAALIEECYEVLEAIDSNDDTNLQEELGDLLLLLLMHTRIAEERSAFRFENVADAVSEKLIRRHPHVFGSTQVEDSADVLHQWEQIKRAEKKERISILDGISKSFPALLRAQSIQKKAARIGFDWSNIHDVFSKLEEEINELKEAIQQQSLANIEDEMGDVLFTVVNIARKLKCSSELCLQSATDKFERRFRAVEATLKNNGHQWEDQSLEDLDKLWDQIKQNEQR